jgi:hypothetical protein
MAIAWNDTHSLRRLPDAPFPAETLQAILENPERIETLISLIPVCCAVQC